MSGHSTLTHSQTPDPVEFEELRRDWDELAALDPFWAVLTEQDRRFRKWRPQAFFGTGEREVEQLLETCQDVGYPAKRERALDFGCGVGRVTRTLARYFRQCYGIDISPKMIELASWLNRPVGNCRFLTNGQDNLHIFPADHFDLICTINVLQHMSGRGQIESYISEFMRTLSGGGLLIFQLPASVPFRHRVRLALLRTGYATLRRAGLNERFVYETLKLSPIRMTSIPEKQVLAYVESIGGNTLKVQKRSEIGLPQSRMYFVTKRRFHGQRREGDKGARQANEPLLEDGREPG